jgi:LmbE family N-acetylglucosaminyl deacetylase
MKHIYLAPHLDDAVLSCGGAICRHTASGDAVLVITVFSGEFKGEILSPFALQVHGEWGNPPKPLALRRAEDMAALALLAAEVRHLDDLDAIYRADPDGRWLYAELGTLLGEVQPADPMVLDRPDGLVDRLVRLVSLENQAILYAPLAVGHHVDHQIVHAAARRLLETGYQVAFYEDYPYAERKGALESALIVAGANNWRAEAISLDPVHVTAKVSALGYYRSQLAVLFGGAGAMPNRVWAFAATRSVEHGLAERIWWPSEA